MNKILLANTGNYALIDEEDYEKVASFGKWYENDNGYAIKKTRIKGKNVSVRMHILVNETSKGLHTDHINGNRLDNRKKNLRSVSPAINAWNTARTSSRKYDLGLPTGIAWDNTRKKYIATKILRKRFDSLEEAIAFQKESELYEYEHRRLKPQLPTGVFRNKSNKGFQSKIQLNGKRIYLGTFATVKEAEEAYLARKRG